MTVTRGGIIGPDGSGGFYKNEIETDRTITWAAMGGRSGIIRGRVPSTVVSSMSLSLSAGATLVAERDASAVELGRGYIEWSDTATVVPFGAPSAGVRKDALVAAVIDTEDGPVGTGRSTGPQILSIPGTSGSSTPLTNAAIQASLGRGGWRRLGDVLISPADTQINLANFTADPGVYLNRYNTISGMTWSGWTANLQLYIPVSSNTYEVLFTLTKTGATISSDSTGNFSPDLTIGSGLPTFLRPPVGMPNIRGVFENDGAKMGGVAFTGAGDVLLSHMYPNTSILAGGNITIRAMYTVAQA